MRLAILGMHRSGTNVIGRWLLRQSPLDNEELVCIEQSDWKEEGYSPKNGKWYDFISQVNHPEHTGWRHRADEFDSVVTIEREGLNYFADFCYENLYTWGHCAIIIRDFRNWLASCFKMGMKKVPELDIIKYRTHLDAVINNPSWVKIINYNLWCVSASYRKQLCKNFELNFTDAGYKNVPSNGGGSSFDGTTYHDKGHEMKTFDRYKQFDDNKYFQQMLEKYKHIVELSDYWVYDINRI